MIMKYNFDKIPNRRGTNSLKWDVDRKELPMWVADMDLRRCRKYRRHWYSAWRTGYMDILSSRTNGRTAM